MDPEMKEEPIHCMVLVRLQIKNWGEIKNFVWTEYWWGLRKAYSDDEPAKDEEILIGIYDVANYYLM